jgi:hypothetical protein
MSRFVPPGRTARQPPRYTGENRRDKTSPATSLREIPAIRQLEAGADEVQDGADG